MAKRKGGLNGAANPPDFKKVKTKLGKKKPLPSNHTRVDFKSKAIYVPGQSLRGEKGKLVNQRNLALEDLIPQLKHYSSSVKKDALHGIKELLVMHPQVLKAQLNVILTKAAECIFDPDDDVRKAYLSLIDHVVSGTSEVAFAPFMSLMVAYLCSGLTHITTSIRMDALEILSLIATNYPALMPEYNTKIMPLLLHLLNMRGGMTRKKKVETLQAILSLLQIQLISNNIDPLHIMEGLDDEEEQADDSDEDEDGESEIESGADKAKNDSEDTMMQGDEIAQRLHEFEWKYSQEEFRFIHNSFIERMYLGMQQQQQQQIQSGTTTADNDSNELTSDAAIANKNNRAIAKQPRPQLQQSDANTMFNLATSDDIFNILSATYNHLVEMWIETLPALTAGEQQPGTSTTAAQKQQQQAAQTNSLMILKLILDIIDTLLRAYEYLHHKFNTDSGVDGLIGNMRIIRGDDRIHSVLEKGVQYFASAPFPFQPTVNHKEKEKHIITSINVTLISFLSFSLGRRASLVLIAAMMTSGSANKAAKKQEALQEWEQTLVDHLNLCLKAKNLSQEDYSKVLKLMRRVYPYLDKKNQFELWKSFSSCYQNSHALSDQKKLCIQFFASVILDDRNARFPLLSLMPPEQVLEFWLNSLPKTIWELKDTNHSLTKYILKVLHALANDPRLEIHFHKLQNGFIPFYYTEISNSEKPDQVKQVFGPFVKLPTELQRIAVHLLYYFRSFSKTFLRGLAKCASDARVDYSIVTLMMEILRQQQRNNRIELEAHIGFLLSLCCINDNSKKSSNIGSNGIVADKLALAKQEQVLAAALVSLFNLNIQGACLGLIYPFLEDKLKTNIASTSHSSVASLLILIQHAIDWYNKSLADASMNDADDDDDNNAMDIEEEDKKKKKKSNKKPAATTATMKTSNDTAATEKSLAELMKFVPEVVIAFLKDDISRNNTAQSIVHDYDITDSAAERVLYAHAPFLVRVINILTNTYKEEEGAAALNVMLALLRSLRLRPHLYEAKPHLEAFFNKIKQHDKTQQQQTSVTNHRKLQQIATQLSVLFPVSGTATTTNPWQS